MKINVYPALPEFFLSRITKFEAGYNGKSWCDLYNALNALSSEHPDKVFKEPPFVYVDIHNRTTGLIFLESNTEELYYVF